MVKNILGLVAVTIAGIAVAAIIGLMSDPSINNRLPSKTTVETSLYTALIFFAVAMQFRKGWQSWQFWTVFMALLVVHTAAYCRARMIRIASASPSRHPTARRLQDKAHAHAESRQHVDQAVRTEQIDASSEQIADARLSDVQQPSGLDLREFSGGERLLELEQQVGTDQQVLRFLCGEPEIPEHIACRWRDLQVAISFHRRLVLHHTGD